MKIIGLFVVVFASVLCTRAMGMSEMAQTIGAVIGGCSFILLQMEG